MPYGGTAEALGLFEGFPTTHYVKKYKAMAPTTRPKVKSETSKRFKNFVRIEAKRCMQRLAEQKHSTTAMGVNPIPAAGAVNSAVIMSQGTSATTRLGQQIHISRITLEALLFTAAATAGDTVRTIIGWDTESNGANVAVTTVLETASPAACYNRDQVGKRIQILMDRVDNVNVMTQAVGTMNKTFRVNKKIDKVVYYQSNAGTISDVLKNNLFYLQVSANAAVGSIVNFQICYTDL